MDSTHRTCSTDNTNFVWLGRTRSFTVFIPEDATGAVVDIGHTEGITSFHLAKRTLLSGFTKWQDMPYASPTLWNNTATNNNRPPSTSSSTITASDSIVQSDTSEGDSPSETSDHKEDSLPTMASEKENDNFNEEKIKKEIDFFMSLTDEQRMEGMCLYESQKNYHNVDLESLLDDEGKMQVTSEEVLWLEKQLDIVKDEPVTTQQYSPISPAAPEIPSTSTATTVSVKSKTLAKGSHLKLNIQIAQEMASNNQQDQAAVGGVDQKQNNQWQQDRPQVFQFPPPAIYMGIDMIPEPKTESDHVKFSECPASPTEEDETWSLSTYNPDSPVFISDSDTEGEPPMKKPKHI